MCMLKTTSTGVLQGPSVYLKPSRETAPHDNRETRTRNARHMKLIMGASTRHLETTCTLSPESARVESATVHGTIRQKYRYPRGSIAVEDAPLVDYGTGKSMV
ncbi:hypothetical protein VTK56DRAFT_4685 [Thermocarpiscus australiensis]